MLLSGETLGDLEVDFWNVVFEYRLDGLSSATSFLEGEGREGGEEVA